MTIQSDGTVDIETLARWYLLSVFRHLQQRDWSDVNDCDLPASVVDELVSAYLADRSARQSLIMVLKESRYRNQLVRFGPNRDQDLLQLSESTIAFRHARTLLQPVLGPSPGDFATIPVEPVAATVNARRAARRAQPMTGSDKSGTSRGESAADSGMSDAEYARLEQALSSSPAGDEPVPRRYDNNADRLSLLYGLLAGALLFILVYWLLL
jgi:hypothetical protein